MSLNCSYYVHPNSALNHHGFHQKKTVVESAEIEGVVTEIVEVSANDGLRNVVRRRQTSASCSETTETGWVQDPATRPGF